MSLDELIDVTLAYHYKRKTAARALWDAWALAHWLETGKRSKPPTWYRKAIQAAGRRRSEVKR